MFMRYVSLFSGIEAASVAWGPLGWEPVAFSEIEPFACAVLNERFPSVPNLGDITRKSVEQVINEMIYCIVRLSERGECGEVMDEGLAAREYNAGLTPCYQAFADRLEALEMTLDGR